jgi:hypothetical protein
MPYLFFFSWPTTSRQTAPDLAKRELTKGAFQAQIKAIKLKINYHHF